MPTNFKIINDIDGKQITGSTTASKLSVNNQFISLAADTVAAITVPIIPGIVEGTLFAIITAARVSTSVPVRVWILPAASPTLTLPTTLANTLASLTDTRTSLIPGQTIQLRSRVAADVSIQYYYTQFMDK